MAAWTAPAIEAAGAVATSATSGLFGINQARKNRAFQERMYYQQLEDNRKNWEMANEYNLPSAVLQRIVDAGLNPLLMYEGGTMAGVTPATGADKPSGAQASANFNNPFHGFTQSMVQMKMLDAQIDLLKSQADKNRADADLAAQNTENVEFNNMMNKLTKDLQISLKWDQHDLFKSTIRQIDNDQLWKTRLSLQQELTLQQARLYQAKEFDLNAWSLGEQWKVAWENVATGKVQANAAWKSACANMLQATSQWNLNNAQIGYIGTMAALNRQQYRFNEKMNPELLNNARWLSQKYRMELTKDQQEAANLFLRNQYQYLNNMYYGRYGVDQLPQGHISKEMIPIGNSLNQVTNTWSPYNGMPNVFTVPLYEPVK